MSVTDPGLVDVENESVGTGPPKDVPSDGQPASQPAAPNVTEVENESVGQGLPANVNQ